MFHDVIGVKFLIAASLIIMAAIGKYINYWWLRQLLAVAYWSTTSGYHMPPLVRLIKCLAIVTPINMLTEVHQSIRVAFAGSNVCLLGILVQIEYSQTSSCL